MILAFKLMEIIQVPFGYIMEWLYQLTSNYGVSLILFSLIVKLILLYPSAKGKKGMMKMTRLNPQLKKLEAKYGDDKKAYQDAMVALYKAEGVSPTGGCLWSLLPLLLLFPLYAVVRQPLTYLLHLNADQVAKIIEILKNGGVALGESSRSAFYQQMVAASHIPEFAEQIRAALPGISETALKGVNFSFLGLDLSATPNFRIWNLEAYDWAHIGLFLLPLFSALIQLLASLATQKLNNSVITNEKGERDKSADAVNNTAKSLLYLVKLVTDAVALCLCRFRLHAETNVIEHKYNRKDNAKCRKRMNGIFHHKRLKSHESVIQERCDTYKDGVQNRNKALCKAYNGFFHVSPPTIPVREQKTLRIVIFHFYYEFRFLNTPPFFTNCRILTLK